MLMDHFGHFSPALLRKWMSGTTGSGRGKRRASIMGKQLQHNALSSNGKTPRGPTTSGSLLFGSGNRGSKESPLEAAPTGKPMHRQSAGAAEIRATKMSLANAGAAVLAAQKLKRGSTSKPDSENLSPEDLIKILGDAFYKKVKLDNQADAKLKPRMTMNKFINDHINLTEGIAAVAKVMRTLRQYSLASDGPLQPRLHLMSQMLGLLEGEAWVEKKVDFLLAFLCIAVHQDNVKRFQLGIAIAAPNDGPNRRSSQAGRRGSVASVSSSGSGSSGRRQSVAESAAAPGAAPAVSKTAPPISNLDRKALSEYLANPQVWKEYSGPMRDAFVQPKHVLSFAAVGKVVELMIVDVARRGRLLDKIEPLAEAVEGMGHEIMVPLDDLIRVVMQGWDEDSMDCEDGHTSVIQDVFKKADGDNDGMIHLAEFQKVVEEHSPETNLDDVMEMYDQAIEYSSEQVGEETDEVTADAFVLVMEEFNVIPPAEGSFIEVCKIAREHIREAKEKEEEEARKQEGPGMKKNKDGRRSLWANIHGSHKEVKQSSSSKSGTEEKLKDFPTIPKGEKVAAIIRRAVKENFLFRHLDSPMIERVIGYFEHHPVKKGDNVITQGDRGDYFYVCETGEYDVFMDGKKVLTYQVLPEDMEMSHAEAMVAASKAVEEGLTLDERMPMDPEQPAASAAAKRRQPTSGRRGSFSEDGKKRRGSFSGMPEASGKHPCFGELALMYSKPRAASVVATQPGKLWKLGRDAFRIVQMMRTTATVDFTKVLRKVEVLGALRFDQLQMLRDRMVERNFDPGEYVFRQGDSADMFYLVAKGQAEIVKHSDDEPDGAVVMEIKQSGYFGERALLHDEPRAASVRASGETTLATACISRKEFELLLGPLQKMLEDNRREREAGVKTQQQQLETFGLSNATRDNFTIEAKISTLPCGVTWLVHHIATNQLYTMREEGKKLIAKTGELERTQHEVDLLKELAGAKLPIPFLPTMLRAFQGPSSLCLLFKQRALCELAAIANRCQGGVLDDRSLNFAGACIARALDVLHRETSHMYRNLAPERIHVMEDGYICLMDYRFAKRDDGSCTTLCGSPSYFAPEMLRGDIQGNAVDWWGLGVLLFELATGDSPWGATDDDDMVLLKRITGHTSGSLAVPQHVNPQLSALLNDLLEPDVELRRGDGSVIADPWFDDVNWPRLLDAEVPSPLQRLAKKCFDDSQPHDMEEEDLEPPDWDALAEASNPASLINPKPMSDEAWTAFNGNSPPRDLPGLGERRQSRAQQDGSTLMRALGGSAAQPPSFTERVAEAQEEDS